MRKIIIPEDVKKQIVKDARTLPVADLVKKYGYARKKITATVMELEGVSPYVLRYGQPFRASVLHKEQIDYALWLAEMVSPAYAQLAMNLSASVLSNYSITPPTKVQRTTYEDIVDKIRSRRVNTAHDRISHAALSLAANGIVKQGKGYPTKEMNKVFIVLSYLDRQTTARLFGITPSMISNWVERQGKFSALKLKRDRFESNINYVLNAKPDTVIYNLCSHTMFTKADIAKIRTYHEWKKEKENEAS